MLVSDESGNHIYYHHTSKIEYAHELEMQYANNSNRPEQL
jgi:hypothetical protein